MSRSYDAARANLYHLWQHHQEWGHAQFAAALGCSVGWVKKWLKRFGPRQAIGRGLAGSLTSTQAPTS
jgi:hypothetical protein